MRELERLDADNELSVLRTVAGLRPVVAAARANGDRIGLVPTMGAFHDGHLSLIRRARSECDFVVVSLFVNPAQFGAGEDLETYPRDERHDAEMAGAAGADLLFAPGADEVYPSGFSTLVEVKGLTDVLCGSPSSRSAGHFRGVTTIVSKLLNMCQPDIAYFGQKDFQQTVVIRRMVRDLDVPVQIAICPTVREADGLALSSRNAHLDSGDRYRATALKRALDAAVVMAPSIEAMIEAARDQLAAADIEPEYVEILDASDLSTAREDSGEVVVAIAAPVGSTRLIDNVVIDLTAANRRVARAA